MGLSERVRFPGYLSDQELAALLEGAELALFPYRSGTGSYALSLALAAGVPAVTSDLPVFAGAPVLRSAAGQEDLRAAIAELLANPERRREQAAAGKAWANARSFAAAAAAHVRIYREALSGAR